MGRNGKMIGWAYTKKENLFAGDLENILQEDDWEDLTLEERERCTSRWMSLSASYLKTPPMTYFGENTKSYFLAILLFFPLKFLEHTSEINSNVTWGRIMETWWNS